MAGKRGKEIENFLETEAEMNPGYFQDNFPATEGSKAVGMLCGVIFAMKLRKAYGVHSVVMYSSASFLKGTFQMFPKTQNVLFSLAAQLL